jgi:ligand-binding sensor domain-containing protein
METTAANLVKNNPAGITHLGESRSLSAGSIRAILVFPMANRPNYLLVLPAVFLLLTGFPALSSTNSGWFTRVWQIDDGLLDNDINGILQGPDEYLWLVTPVGLMRFDGVKFSRFPTDVLTGPTATHIRMMSASRNGLLWMAFDGGRVIGLKADFSVYSLDNFLLPMRPPTALANDADGALWLGYPDVIYRVQNGQIIKLAPKEGVPAGPVRSLTTDGLGNIWLAKGNQIACFRNGTFNPVASVDVVQCMAPTHTNAVWLVANAHLFSCDVDGKLLDCGAFQDPANARTAALLEDHNGSVWIGTDGNGLFLS